MGSIKIIIIILCVVGFIIKTIAGDAKRDRKAQAQPTPPQPRAPKIPIPSTPQPPMQWPEAPPSHSHYNVEGESIGRVSTMTTASSMVTHEPVDEEARQAELERWRRALIDSEILKTKF